MTTFLPKTSFIGFEHLLDQINQVTEHAKDTYPRHNVIRLKDKAFLIEMAVAGFAESELGISLKDNILTVTGEQSVDGSNIEYIHKGISTRKFSKSFRLSEYTQVVGASLKNGILSISLEVIVPEEKAPRIINIKV